MEQAAQKDRLTAAGVTKIIAGVAGGMRRRGLPATVDLDDLRQEAEIAVLLSGCGGPASLIARIARNAMLDHLRDRNRECRGVSLGVNNSGAVVAPALIREAFFSETVDSLEARHMEWESERSEEVA